MIKRLQCENPNKKIIYLGDGVGDYCPSLRLKEGDHVMPRKNYPVYDLITSNPELITAKIHEWVDGGDLEQVLLSLIQAIMSINGDDHHDVDEQFVSIDFTKLKTLPNITSLPKALCVTF